MLNRVCTADYAVPEAAYTIRRGTAVVVSLMGFARDERYFPQPERFWPERFEPDVRAFDEAAFMPFGAGPRQCIGKCGGGRSEFAQRLCDNVDTAVMWARRFAAGQNGGEGGPGAAAAFVRVRVRRPR